MHVRVGLAFLIGAALAGAADAAPPRPTVDFSHPPFIQDPQLSPDGTSFAAKLTVDGRQMFAIVPLAGGKPRLITFGEKDLNWWSWVNDDWLVAGIGETQPVQGEDWYVRRALAISADTKTLRLLKTREGLGQNADTLVWTATDGTPRLMLGMQQSIYANDVGIYPGVFEFDLGSDKVRAVVRPYEGVTEWFADRRGVVRIGIGQLAAGRASRLLYRAEDKGSFKVVDRADSRRGTSLTTPALFLADPTKALAFHDDDNGYTALYEFDLQTQTLGKSLSAVPGYDLAAAVVDRAEGRLLGVRVETDRAETRWVDPDLASLQAAVDKSVGVGRYAQIVSLSRDLHRAIIHVGSPSEPGRYYVMDRAEGVMRLFAHLDTHIHAPLHPVRTVRYKARDGVEISAVVTEPDRQPGKLPPLIVMPHGGPSARDSESWDWWAQFLADRGYVVVQPNYRGSSGFGTQFTMKGEGQWGLAMQDDLDDAVAWAGHEGLADAARTCIVGASYGGYAALRAAQRGSKPYRCAVSYAGVSDLPRLRRYDSQFLNSAGATDWLSRQAPDLRLVSPLNYPEQFSIPVLIVHGKKDRRVPIDQSRALADRLKRLGKTVTYIEQPLADHFFSRGEDRLEFLQALERFLTSHNPA